MSATEAHYIIESDRHAFYFYDPDSDKKPLTADMFRTKNAERLLAMEERRRRELES